MADYGGQSKGDPCGGTCPACRGFQKSERDSRDDLLRTFALREFGAALWNALQLFHGEESFRKWPMQQYWFWLQESELPAWRNGSLAYERWPLFGVKAPRMNWDPAGLKWAPREGEARG